MESGLHVYRYHSAILLLCAKQQILLDQILGIVCVAMIWFVLFLFFIEHDRAEGLISHNRETDFKKVLYSYTAAAVVVVFASYFPGFVKPLVFVPLIIAASSAVPARITPKIVNRQYNFSSCECSPITRHIMESQKTAVRAHQKENRRLASDE